MTRLTLSVLLALSVLTTCSECYAGYTVHVDGQRQEWSTVNGPEGPQPWRASAEAPPPPPTYGAELCRPDNYSPFAAETARRTRVFSDNLGIASLSDILSACPTLRQQIIAKIKILRKQALAQLTIDSGVSAVYSENYAAAVAYKAGAGASTIMKDGQTAANYLTGFGAQLGMSAGQFADYIIAENRRVGPTAYQIEQEYLRLAYTAVPQETDLDRLLAYPDDYRRFCGL